jgi:serine/threonine-protein kinase
MHREEHPMFTSLFKSRKARTLAAATCLAGTACASVPKPLPPPPLKECPPDAYAAMVSLDIDTGSRDALLPPYGGPIMRSPVKAGPALVKMMGTNWQGLPENTFFAGQIFTGADRVYGFFTEARLPTGEVVPVCLEMADYEERGMPLEPGSTLERPIIVTSVTLRSVTLFKRK